VHCSPGFRFTSSRLRAAYFSEHRSGSEGAWHTGTLLPKLSVGTRNVTCPGERNSSLVMP
ncbi:MAG: hypothetical protein ABW100_20960, partial [Candidatus Thiodiazotropha sp. 6PLUC3]